MTVLPVPRPLVRAGSAALAALLLALLPAAPSPALEAELYASGVGTALLGTAPDGDPRLFLVEQTGRIRIVRAGGVVDADVFLDLSGKVSNAFERGLLGLVFHPQFPADPRLFVYYTGTNGDSVVEAFVVPASGTPPATPTSYLDPDSGDELLRIAQPFANHNGGTLAFGPDGLLYLGTGDGGFRDDPDDRAQNPADLLGKLLRTSVAGSPPYTWEVFGIGLRNPYRFAFDPVTGALWIADVGQDRWEEINYEPFPFPSSVNWGWDVQEGFACNGNDPTPSPPAPLCGSMDFTDPVHVYEHTGGNCSVTGGFPYRGVIPGIQGHYFFGDYCSGRIWSLDPANFQVTDRTAELGGAGTSSFALVGFARDGFGELYVVLRRNGGEVWRIFDGALPSDSDVDGYPDHADNCPQRANDQTDTGGVGVGSAPDGTGDACQCGDVDDDGFVTGLDGTLVTRAALNLMPFPGGVGDLAAQDKCDVGGTPGCNGLDGILIKRGSLGLPPGVFQVCPAAVGP